MERLFYKFLVWIAPPVRINKKLYRAEIRVSEKLSKVEMGHWYFDGVDNWLALECYYRHVHGSNHDKFIYKKSELNYALSDFLILSELTKD